MQCSRVCESTAFDFARLLAKVPLAALAGGAMRSRGHRPMDDQHEEEESRKHHADLVSKLYIAFGVPSIIMFMVILFAFTRWFNIPA